MNNVDIVRAWKDADFRASLDGEDLSHLPENPAGVSELSDEDLQTVAGGTTWLCAITFFCVTYALSCMGCGTCDCCS